MPKNLTEITLRMIRKPYLFIPLVLAALGCFCLPAPWNAPLLCLVLTPLTLCALCFSRRKSLLCWFPAPPEDSHLLSLNHVDVSAGLLTGGRQEVRSAAHPFITDNTLRLTSGSSMLLLATAAILTADQQSPARREAIVHALSPMGFTPAALQKRCPILGEAALDGVTGIVCRDGLGQRAYFAADPAALLARCPLIWDGAPRPMAEEDRRHALANAGQMAEAGCQPLAYATVDLRSSSNEAVFLGMLGIGDVLPAEEVLAPLHKIGLTVSPAGEADVVSLPWLKKQMGIDDLPAADVLITPYPAENTGICQMIAAPDDPWPDALADHLITLRRRENALRRQLWLMALLFLLAAAVSPAIWSVPFLAAITLPGTRHPEWPQPRACLRAYAVTLAGSALLAWFLRSVSLPALPELSVIPLSLVMAFASAPRMLHPAWPAWLTSAALCTAAVIISGAGLIPAIFMVIAGLLQGVICRLLLHAPGKKR